MASNPTTPRINVTQDATTASRRHKSYLQWCCPAKVCEKDFHTVTDRLEVIKFRPLFEAFIHYNKEGEVVSYQCRIVRDLVSIYSTLLIITHPGEWRKNLSQLKRCQLLGGTKYICIGGCLISTVQDMTEMDTLGIW